MLQKLSLILLCGLVVMPTQSVNADATCRRLFEIVVEVDNNSAPQRAGLIDYKIENEAGSITIHRSQGELAALFKQGYEISRYFASKSQLFAKFPAIDTLLKEYSPFLPFKRIASTISDLQMSLIEARNQSELALTKDSIETLKEEMTQEIKTLEQKIIETENLAYKLEIITTEVSKSQNAIILHRSLFAGTLSQHTVYKNNLLIVKALKRDLMLVSETKTLQPTFVSKRFYETAPTQTATPEAVETKTAEPVRLQRRPHVYLFDAREKPTIQEAPDYRTMIGSVTGQGTVRPTAATGPEYSKLTTGQGTARITQPEQQMLGIVSGQGTMRSTTTHGFENPGRGRVTTLALQTGITGKVDMNLNSRSLLLNLQYDAASKTFPASKMLEELREWARYNNIHTLMTFTHSGKIEDPILVTVRFKDDKMARNFLQKLKEDFETRKPQFTETKIKTEPLPTPFTRKINVKFSQHGTSDMLARLRKWTQDNNLFSQIVFGHSGRPEEAISVVFRTKDEKTAEILLYRLREAFNQYNPQLRE